MDETVWGNISFDGDQIKYVSVGDLHIWMKSQNGEVWIAYGYKDELKGRRIKPDALPSNVTWGRWANKVDAGEVQMLPAFPEMPLVVHSEYPLKISPDTKIQIFTRIPVWIRISLAKNNYQLIELPTVKLSRTWFGSPDEGELCYYATTKARRDLSKIEKKPYLVSCPIMISNKSAEALDFDNFCFRVERLSIFLHEDEFWADETQIIYHGAGMNSDIIMTGKLPKGIDRKKLLSKPRKQIQKSLATRTFQRIFEDKLSWRR